MWEPLHGLLSLPTTTDGLRLQTLWVLGTALQNNPAAQLSVCQTSHFRCTTKFDSPVLFLKVLVPGSHSRHSCMLVILVKLCGYPIEGDVRAIRPVEAQCCCS